MDHMVGSLMTTKYKNACCGVHSTTQHLTFPRGEIKSQPNQLSAHIVNFRSKPLDSVLTLKAEITRLADHSIIKKIKIKS